MSHKLLSAHTTAAVPNAVWHEIAALENNTTVPLGHAFELYFPFLDDRQGCNVADKNKANVLRAVADCSVSLDVNNAISKRTTHLALQNTDTLTVPLQSNSAFITGSGIDHPSENGLAFLRPYGVPYLAGSGIKGVLRDAAERKVYIDNDPDWCIADVWWLFGWDGKAEYLHSKNALSGYFQAYLDKAQPEHKAAIQQFFDFLTAGSKSDMAKNSVEHLAQLNIGWAEQLAFRGLLDFWDMPLTEAVGTVDVMTPHYGDYYEGKSSPHDAADPVPISMLAIKAGAKGRLTLQWCGRGLTDAANRALKSLHDNWQESLTGLIEDVIKWDGFGAKTAVGYGRFAIDVEAEERVIAEQQAKEKRVALEQALLGLSELAIEFRTLASEKEWDQKSGRDLFLATGVIECWLDKLEVTEDVDLQSAITELITLHIPGVLTDPDKVKGKKKKHVYTQRQRDIAHRLNSYS